MIKLKKKTKNILLNVLKETNTKHNLNKVQSYNNYYNCEVLPAKIII